jgi:hypothetical protein
MLERPFGSVRSKDDTRADVPPVIASATGGAKSAGDPALEVADFIMHAAGRAARYRLEGKHSMPPDFDAVFRHCHPLLTSLMFVDRIEERPGEPMDAAVGFGLALPDGSPVQTPLTRSISFPTG